MSYPRVLALLDAQLQRLRTAREILTAGVGRNGDAEKLSQLPEMLAGLAASGSSADAASSDAAVLPTRVAPRQRRERRAAGRRQKQTDPGALGSAVPHAPVYVSADKLRSARVEREAAQGPPAKAEDQLSPELLARRWLQGSAN